MLDNETIKLITIWGNTAIIVAAMVAASWVGWRLGFHQFLREGDARRLSAKSVCAAIGMLLLFTGISLRVGFWIPGVLFSENGGYFAQWFLDHRWQMVMIASVLIVGGIGMLLRELIGFSRLSLLKFVAAAFTIGTLLAISRLLIR